MENNSKSTLKRKANMNLQKTDLTVEASYMKSPQRDICPACGGKLAQVEIERDDDSTYAAATIKWECKHCGAIIIQNHKWPKRKRPVRKAIVRIGGQHEN